MSSDILVPIPIQAYMDWTKKEGMLAISMELMIKMANSHFDNIPWWKKLIIRQHLKEISIGLQTVQHIGIKCGRELLITTALAKNEVSEINVHPDHKSLTGGSYAYETYTHLFGELNEETT